MAAMPTVRVLPDEILLEAEDGQTIIEAAWEAGYYWPTVCGGQGMCTSCTCVVEDGIENVEPMGRAERKTLAEERSDATLAAGRIRLACQARVCGDVVVTKRGVRLE